MYNNDVGKNLSSKKALQRAPPFILLRDCLCVVGAVTVQISGEGGSCLHSGIEFERSMTGTGLRGRKKSWYEE
jgi:hypothetical protein